MKKLILSLLLSFTALPFIHGAATGLPAINFTTSQAQFAIGDSITIKEVFATSTAFAPGDTVVVRGDYTLQSREAAVLGISLTVSASSGSGLTPIDPSWRKSITAGSGTFEFEYKISQVGTLHVSFSPTTSGSSFGTIYFAAASGTPGTPTPTNPTPTTPTETPPIDTAGLTSVPFATSRVQFEPGDSITLQQVLASSPLMEPGDRVVVRGQYTLQSRAQGLIMISLTVNAPGYTEKVAPAAFKRIDAGSGTFELEYEIKQPGSLHVTFYPATSGSSFGGIYFAPPGSSTSGSSSTIAIKNPTGNVGKFGNLSVRSNIAAGDGALVAGITVTEQERYVLIRGVGPSLAAFGVSGVLRKPTLTVHSTSGEVIATGGAWSAAFTGDRRTGIEMLARSVGAFPLSAGSDDAVLNLRLTPGSYTVTLATGDGQPGVALLEVYASSTYSLPAP